MGDLRLDDACAIIASEMEALLPDDISPDILILVAPPSVGDIMRVVAAFYGIPIDLLSARHKRGLRASRHNTECRRYGLLSFARHMVCHLARQLTSCSHAQIAHRLGGFDHTICSKSGRSLAKLMLTDETVRDDADILRLQLLELMLQRCEGSCH
jgi:hypothetical protein